MLCKKALGGPSLRTALCTCKRQHADTSEALYTACVGRVVDRTYRVAKRIGEVDLAEKLYKKAYACRPTKQGDEYTVSARQCLMGVLGKLVLGTHLDGEKMGSRKLLSAISIVGLDVDEISDPVEPVKGTVRVDKVPAGSPWKILSLRVLAVLVYVVGLVIILLGVSDITTYWRRFKVRWHIVCGYFFALSRRGVALVVVVLPDDTIYSNCSFIFAPTVLFSSPEALQKPSRQRQSLIFSGI